MRIRLDDGNQVNVVQPDAKQLYDQLWLLAPEARGCIGGRQAQSRASRQRQISRTGRQPRPA